MLRSVTWRLGVQRKLLKKELASGVRRAAVIACTGWNEKALCNWTFIPCSVTIPGNVACANSSLW